MSNEKHFEKAFEAIRLHQPLDRLLCVELCANETSAEAIAAAAKKQKTGNMDLHIGTPADNVEDILSFLRLKYPYYNFYKLGKNTPVPPSVLAFVHIEIIGDVDKLQVVWKSLMKGGIISFGCPEGMEEEIEKRVKAFMTDVMQNPSRPQYTTDKHCFFRKQEGDIA